MCRTFDCPLVLLHARLRLPRGRVTMSVPRISNNSFWGFGFGKTSVSRTSWTSTATATTMELYRRARGALPVVFTLISFWVGLCARDFPTERVLSRTPLIIRTVDQNRVFFFSVFCPICLSTAALDREFNHNPAGPRARRRASAALEPS